MQVRTLLHAALAAAAVVSTVAGGGIVSAQTRVATFDDMRRQLHAGDTVWVTRANGERVTGRLLRVGETDLEVRTKGVDQLGDSRRLDVKVPNADIRSIVRPRDPVRNGVLIGAGIAGGFSLVMFASAVAIDRNEMDEWGPGYAARAAALTGLGALIGGVIDAAHSRPHLEFDARPGGGTRVSLAPMTGRRRGMAVVVSF